MTIEQELPAFAADVAAALAASDFHGLTTMIQTIQQYADIAARETEAEATRIYTEIHAGMCDAITVHEAEPSAFEFSDAMIGATTEERCRLMELAGAHAGQAAWQVVRFMLDAQRSAVVA